MPVLIELMMLIAEQNDAKYTSGMERNKKEERKDSVIQNALAKFAEEEMVEDIVEEEPKGLMSRRDTWVYLVR